MPHMRGGLANLGSDFRAGLGGIGAAAAAEIAEVCSEVRGVERDLASVRPSVEECRAENMELFESFAGSLEAAQHGIEIMRSSPLKEAEEVFLKDFEASNGDVEFLKDARSKIDSPRDAKSFTVDGTLSNIIRHLAPTWADPSATATAENAPVLPKLDKRLLPAFGALCAADPELRRMYPVVAGVAVKAMLEAKTMRGLFQLAEEVRVDVDTCTSKDAVVQALLASGKSLVPGPAVQGRALPGPQAAPALVHDATTDRAALVGLFNDTGGASRKNSAGWGTPAPLGEWYGVTMDGVGRFLSLALGENNLDGPIPSAPGNLTPLEYLTLYKNQLTGPIPPALGRLAAMQMLCLSANQFSGERFREQGGRSADAPQLQRGVLLIALQEVAVLPGFMLCSKYAA